MRSHRAIDKANLVIAVLKFVAHGRSARREGLGVQGADDERLPAGAIGRSAAPEEAHSGNDINKIEEVIKLNFRSRVEDN